MSEPLKPCPFCGGKDARVFSFPSADDESKSDYYVACERCGAAGPAKSRKKDAIGAWNTRAEPERHVLGEGVPWLSADVDFGRHAVVLTKTEAWHNGHGVDLESAWPGTRINGRYRLVLEKVEES